MSKLLSNFRTKFFPERVREQICISETGFLVRFRDEVKMRVEWVRVLEVFAFKSGDPFAEEQICVGFRYDQDGSNWWVGEETLGYAELLQIMPEKFPGIRESWRREMTFPLFPASRITLWGESLSQGKD